MGELVCQAGLPAAPTVSDGAGQWVGTWAALSGVQICCSGEVRWESGGEYHAISASISFQAFSGNPDPYLSLMLGHRAPGSCWGSLEGLMLQVALRASLERWENENPSSGPSTLLTFPNPFPFALI